MLIFVAVVACSCISFLPSFYLGGENIWGEREGGRWEDYIGNGGSSHYPLPPSPTIPPPRSTVFGAEAGEGALKLASSHFFFSGGRSHRTCPFRNSTHIHCYLAPLLWGRWGLAGVGEEFIGGGEAGGGLSVYIFVTIFVVSNYNDEQMYLCIHHLICSFRAMITTTCSSSWDLFAI